MVRESAEDGEIQEHEEDLIHSVFDMGEKLVRQLRTPRTDVVGVDLDYEALGVDNGMLMVTAAGTAVKLR